MRFMIAVMFYFVFNKDMKMKTLILTLASVIVLTGCVGETNQVSVDSSENTIYTTADQDCEYYTDNKNWEKAFPVCLRAAKQGNMISQFYLGWMYDNGDGVSKNENESVKWYKLAAKQGNANSQYNLGVIYDNGEGVHEDENESVKWYKLAAKQGHAKAQNNLGWMYENGEYKNYGEAFKWYEKASMNGNDTAQYNLGETLSRRKRCKKRTHKKR